MKIVQTFWSGANHVDRPLHLSGGWAFPEYNWMSWALSALLLRRHYDQLELYTDEIGKSILIDTLKLPYTKVHIVFDEHAIIHPKLFALAKIHTYNLQEDPFVHIDGDLFLWNPLPEHLKNARLIASNPEVDLFFNKKILDQMEEHFPYIPTHLKNLNKKEHIFASNAGIFGGSDTGFVRKYCSEAHRIVEKNENYLENVDLGLLNMLIEQISLFYMAATENIDTAYCVSEPVDHPLYQDYWRFADIPDVAMIHPVGGCKRIPYVLYHLARRLQLEFPSMYYHILQCCKNESMPLQNRLYDFLNIKTIGDGERLCRGEHFQNSIDLEGLKSTVYDTNAFYTRTLLTIRHFYPKEKISEKELERFIRTKDPNDTIQEIFQLETLTKKCFKQLFEEIKNGEIYGSDISNYKNITAFTMNSRWTDQEVMLKRGTLLVPVSKPWGLLNAKEPQKALLELLEAPKKEYCLTLSMDSITFNIQESYYEGLDAVIISTIKNPIPIEALLKKILSHFDEELEIENPSYQSLIFDTLKRMAFENVMTIL